MGTSRSRTSTKLHYEPRVDILQHGYNVRAAKYGKLARLVPTETSFFLLTTKRLGSPGEYMEAQLQEAQSALARKHAAYVRV